VGINHVVQLLELHQFDLHVAPVLVREEHKEPLGHHVDLCWLGQLDVVVVHEVLAIVTCILYELSDLPVVDRSGRFLGLIGHIHAPLDYPVCVDDIVRMTVGLV